MGDTFGQQQVYRNNEWSQQASVVQSPPPADQSSPPGVVQRKKYFIIGLVLLLFLLSIGIVGASVAVAYNKVSLGDNQIEAGIKQVVLGVPFMPKTPEYVLAKIVEAHGKVSSHSFNASLAITSDSLLSEFGVGSIDVEVEGDVDYEDKDNLQFELNASVTKDFNMDAIKKDSQIFLKFNKVPSANFTLLGLDKNDFDDLLANWIAYDVTSLDTDARDLVQRQDGEGGSMTSRIATRLVQALEDEQILNKITLANEDYEGVPVYRLEFKASKEDIDYLGKKLNEVFEKERLSSDSTDDRFSLSNVIKKLEVSLRVGREDSLVYFVSALLEVELNEKVADSVSLLTPYIGDSSKYSTAFVLKMGNFNKQVDLASPANTLNFDEFLRKALESVDESTPSAGLVGAINLGRQFAQARDTQRRSDLLQITNAIYQYAAEHNGDLPDTDNNIKTSNFPVVPTCIGASPACFNLGRSGGNESIVPTYIAAVPEDPSIGTSSNTGYTIFVDSNGRLVAEAKGELTPQIWIQR